MVRAPKTHVSPNKNIMPVMLINNLTAVLWFMRPIVFLVCLTRTVTIMINMTTLKSRTARIGPKKALDY